VGNRSDLYRHTRDHHNLVFDLVKVLVGDCEGCHVDAGEQVVKKQRVVVFKLNVRSDLVTTVMGRDLVD
jgi:hypothetical protein